MVLPATLLISAVAAAEGKILTALQRLAKKDSAWLLFGGEGGEGAKRRGRDGGGGEVLSAYVLARVWCYVVCGTELV
eukprot:2580235-Rhodomonas_salina.2